MQNNSKKIQSYMLAWLEKTRGFLSSAQEQFHREQSFIGIDVGASSVKIVRMANVNGQVMMTKCTCVDIGGTPGSQEEVLASLKTALIGLDTQGAQVTAIVNCPQTCTRKVVAPHMPKKELEQAIHWEAKNAIPFSLDEALMDYEVIGEVMEKGVKKMIVMVAASPKETVDKMVSLLSRADIEITAMIPLSVGLQNLIAASQALQTLNVAAVEMGAAVTELNIYQKGRLAFSRKLPITGNDITKAMTSTLMSGQGKIELSFQDAERIKKEVGIPQEGSTESIDGKILPVQVLSLVRPCIEQLANEIERSFDFFREDARGEKVDKVILFGGGANLKGLIEALNKDLGIDIEAGNALTCVKSLPGADKDGVDAGVRADLAIGAALHKKDKVNLLPAELKEKTRRFVEKVSLKAVLAGVVMAVFLTYIGLQIQLAAQQKNLSALQLEQKTLMPQLEVMRSAMVADRLFREHPYWEDVLREISNLVEPKMYLTQMHMSDDVITLEGVIVKSEQDAQKILSNYMIKLEEGIFRHVSLGTVNKQSLNASITEFEISAEVE